MPGAGMQDQDLLEKNERLRLALTATGLGTWDMDLVNNRRHWSDETVAMHGLQREAGAGEHIDLTDQIMHPEDREKLASLHDELRAGRDDYFFEYRTQLPDGRTRWIRARGKVLSRTAEGPTRIVGVSADITEQKLGELKQQYDQAQFRLLADSLPQLVWIADSLGQVTYYNSRRASYSDGTSSRASTLLWQPILHPDDLQKTAMAWTKALKSGEDYEFQHRLHMADGSFRWHLSRATPVQGSDGRIAAWFGTATDIERLKQAEDHIQSGVERLQIATEAAAMFAWEMNFRNGAMVWADNAAIVIGCSRDDLGPGVETANFFVHGEDRNRVSEEFNHHRQSGSDRFEMDFRGTTSEGRPRFWRTAVRFIRDDDGEAERAVGVTQDVTRHVEATTQVRLLNERLSAAEEGSGALVYDYDVAANQLWRSNNVTRILGWKTEDIGQDLQSWRAIMHPDDAARVAAIDIHDLLDADDHYALEYRVRHKQGGYRWVMDTGRAYRDAEGNIIRHAGTTIDITSRKKLEQAQQRMSNLIELSFEPILVWSVEQGILDWNRGAEALYGYSRSEAIGQKPFELLKTRHMVGVNDIMEHLRRNPTWTGQVLNIARDGTSIIVESRYELIEFDGERVVLETNRDVREARRAEATMARMAAVAAASHDALYGANLDGEIEAWNPGAEQLLGFSAKEAIGQHVSILAHPDQHAEQVSFLKRVAAGETIKPFDTIRKTRDGRLIDVSIAMSPVTAPDGSVTAVSVALHDIGERKEWDRRQRLMNRELAHRVKNSFAILQAILRSTLKSSPAPQDFAAAFSGRLHSMAAAHDVLTANDWRGAELKTLLSQQLSRYVPSQRVTLDGDNVNLAAEHAAPLGLIFNELATNALKYGALATASGHITVAWKVKRDTDTSNVVDLSWIERGGPPIMTVGPRGFGSTLIERSLAGAKILIAFPPAGMEFSMSWSVSTVTA